MTVIVLIGPPGSGKSTVCQEYFPEYTRISQDVLGSKEAAIKAYREALERKENIVVDRCNHNRSQRSVWIMLAKQFGYDTINAIHLVVDENECIARIHSRKGHETISETMSLEKKMSIVNNFAAAIDKDPPVVFEGFSAVITIRN